MTFFADHDVVVVVAEEVVVVAEEVVVVAEEAVVVVAVASFNERIKKLP